MPSLEERLRRIEELLLEISRRLDDLERSVGAPRVGSEIVSAAVRGVAWASRPALEAVAAAERFVRIIYSHPWLDPVSRAVVESLSPCDGASISEVVRRVREIRGSASRRVVRERLSRLEEMGVVVSVGPPGKPRLYLSECLGPSREAGGSNV